METVYLPPEIWDRIFDFLPFEHQLRTATVCRAWNRRVACWATFRLSALDHKSKDHILALKQTLRNYRSFSVETLTSENDFQCIQKVVKVCKSKFIAQKFYFKNVTSSMLVRFVQEHLFWFSTLRSLLVCLKDNDDCCVMDILQNLSNLRELKLLNVCDSMIDLAAIRSMLITKLTIDAVWYFNDEALEELLDAVCSCHNLTDFTLRSNDTASLGKIAKNLTNLRRLTLLSMTVLVDEDLFFPSLKYLNFDIEWFVFDKPFLFLETPHLESLKISKGTIHFVKFSECTKITKLELFGYCLSTAHPCFSSVKRLNLTTWEPPNQETVVEELELFPNLHILYLKLRSKECTIDVPNATVFQHISRLHLNNFVMSMHFFTEIERMKLFEHLVLEECNFFPDPTDNNVRLRHLSCFLVKRISMAMTTETFPVIVHNNQPPIVIVDKIRTHLWRNDHFNVFSSRQ